MKDNFGLNEDEYERFIELYSKIVRENPEEFGEIREMTKEEKETVQSIKSLDELLEDDIITEENLRSKKDEKHEVIDDIAKYIAEVTDGSVEELEESVIEWSPEEDDSLDSYEKLYALSNEAK
jgi:hypothetical protein